ncbi:cellulose synthase-like protein G3 isoform X2 [Diospyros lotus]|uniref:cellulose synthase-like protein G3 isoform X2 n=1 Tax=Diospyros lotus TaxID=55363 RepID=UPI002251D6DC|nr:cellulose synthase-like protein G3 isoform X2 [Diospyros lotus]
MEEYATAKQPLLLHTLTPSRRTLANRAFALVYTCAILAVLCRHAAAALGSATFLSFVTSATLFIADLVLGFGWLSAQSFRFRPVHRRVFPENLEKVVKRRDFPALDIFICTADPYKEPPMSVVNTALSVMAYDYPPEKISVYVSDDGGSQLTLFAFMEAARFASHWIPFCRKKEIMERCPEAFFGSNYSQSSETEQIKTMYENIKEKVEHVVERGKIPNEFITCEQERQAFNKWTEEFTRQDHPTIIQVLLEAREEKDITGQSMPNLVYLSREKSKMSSHHFKAGALNALVRVSAIVTNAPIILTLDCDMYSNDPKTPHNMLCFFSDPEIKSNLEYVQFPQHFHGINKHDIYANEIKRLFQINAFGLDGLAGPNYVGTGCFFWRRVFFGGPLSFVDPEIPELRPDHVVDRPIKAQPVMALAHHVANCKYEEQTNRNWGAKLGFRYGSLVEDYYTGFRLQCEGWKAVLCNPNRPAFLGDTPITLIDALNQTKRWAVGLLEVGFSKYSPLTFGARKMGPLMGLGYAHYAFWPLWSIPTTIYAFLPQLTLLNGVSIFPEVWDKWFLVYVFLFVGAYGQDCLDFMVAGGSFQRWWSDQRMWMVRGVTSHWFGLAEFGSKRLGIATHGFTLTSKVVDDEQGKRYDQGTFEFGVHSPMFVPLAMAAIVNLAAFFLGFIEIALKGGSGHMEPLFVQMFIAGFVVVNSWPVYEAMVLRTDKGRIPTKTTLISTFQAWTLCIAASLILRQQFK